MTEVIVLLAQATKEVLDEAPENVVIYQPNTRYKNTFIFYLIPNPFL